MRLLAIIAALCLSAPAFAQTQSIQTQAAQSQPSDQEILRACIQEHGADRAFPCIGSVSRACSDSMGEDAASTSAGVVLCAGREHDAWGALFSQAEAQLRAGETETQLALLGAALAAGETWAAARCAYAASIYEGGSLARVVRAGCARDAMALRALELLARIEMLDLG